MQGPHDHYSQTKLKAVLILAELEQCASVEPDPKPSLLARLKAFFNLPATGSRPCPESARP